MSQLEAYQTLAELGRSFGADTVEDLADSARTAILEWLSDRAPAGVVDALENALLLSEIVHNWRIDGQLGAADAHQVAMLIPTLQGQLADLTGGGHE